MSASMAAATGEVEWIDRYRSFEPKLDAAIKQAIDIAQRPDIADAIGETDAANIELVKLENQAFALVRARRLEQARAILSGTSYLAQKQLYAGGMKKRLRGLRAERESTIAAQRTRTRGSILGMGIVAAVIIVVWLIVLGRVRDWRAAMSKSVGDLLEAEEALRRSHDDLERRVGERTRDLEDEIAERNRASAALRDSEERLISLLDESPFGVAITKNSNGRVVFGNDRMADMFGIDRFSLVGTAARDFYDDEDELRQVLIVLERDGGVRDREVLFKRKDGHTFWALLTTLPFRYGDEAARISWFFDITDRKRAANILSDQLKFTEALVDTVPNPVFVKDPELRFVSFNRAYEEAYGIRREDYIGKTEMGLDYLPLALLSG